MTIANPSPIDLTRLDNAVRALVSDFGLGRVLDALSDECFNRASAAAMQFNGIEATDLEYIGEKLTELSDTEEVTRV